MIVIHKITDEGELISIEQIDKDLEGTLTEILIPKEDANRIKRISNDSSISSNT